MGIFAPSVSLTATRLSWILFGATVPGMEGLGMAKLEKIDGFGCEHIEA
jgi:hypothetical protein